MLYQGRARPEVLRVLFPVQVGIIVVDGRTLRASALPGRAGACLPLPFGLLFELRDAPRCSAMLRGAASRGLQPVPERGLAAMKKPGAPARLDSSRRQQQRGPQHEVQRGVSFARLLTSRRTRSPVVCSACAAGDPSKTSSRALIYTSYQS